jgi:hypothetical protein
MAMYFVPATDAGDELSFPFAFLRIDDNGSSILAVYPDGREEPHPPGQTLRAVLREEQVGLLRQVSESEAMARLAPGRDRPSTAIDDTW